MKREVLAISADEQHDLLAREWDVPWHAHVVPVAMVALFAGLWLSGVTDENAGLWRISWDAIERGAIAPVFLHMFAHGGFLHLAMNGAALLFLGGALVATLGNPPASWLRFVYLFLGSGLCGAALFLLLNREATASMLGASGAIFGVLGALARVHPLTGTVLPMGSHRTWLVAKFFLHNHALLFFLVFAVALTTGQSTLLAWEAHLGGLLFGFFAAPAFLERPARDAET